MHTPTQAILWQIFWRVRWHLAFTGIFLLVAIATVHTLPHHWVIRVGGAAVPAVGWYLGTTCIFANILLVAAFGMSDTDSGDLMFARHMFVLPVRTSVLVACPLVSGCVTIAAVWLINATLVFRASGIAAPLWWPAAALALFMATFQALAWTPFAQRWLHGIVTVAVLMAPIPVLLVMLRLDARMSDPAAAATLGALIPIAYLAAHSGVARARRSEFYDWRSWARFTEWRARWRPVASHPFRSPIRAQLWFECRAHILVPLFIACMMPCFFFVPALEPHNVALGWRLLGILLFAPVLVGMLAGGGLGSLVDPLSKHQGMAFVLARPISSMSIVRSKMVMVAMMTAAIWILFLGYISLLLLRPGFPQSIQHAMSSVPTWKAIGYPILVLSLLVMLTWKSMVESLWIGLSGRKWVEITSSMAFAGLIFASFGLGLWIALHPELRAAALAAVPWFIGLLLAIKLVAAAFAVYGLLHLRVTTAGGAAILIGVWLAAVILLCTLTIACLPRDLAAPTKVIPGMVLLVPFARLIGAPLALQWNRHR